MSSPQSNMNPGMDLSPLQMSSSSLPNLPPAPQNPAGHGPQVVAPPEHPKKSSKGWIWGLVLIAAAGVGYWAWQQRQQQALEAAVVAVRTAPVETVALSKTLRLTGVTAAEKYVSLIAPSLRGGRGGPSSPGVGQPGGRGNPG